VRGVRWTAFDCSGAAAGLTYHVNVGTRTLITVAEFEKLPDDGNLHELDEGELIVMPPPRPRHGKIQAAVSHALSKAAEKTGAGVVLIECGFRLAPDVAQAPDVVFIREERRAEITWDRYCEFGPDLAVEILSPDDSAARLQRKISRHLAAGTSIVWVLDPDSITVHVYQKPDVFRSLTADDRIDAPDLLPGFSIPVRTLFE
jgi:Uma2 family endonuclease